MTVRLAAVVLAGGSARRLGGVDKTLLEVGGKPLLQHLLDTLQDQTDALAINANGDPARFASFGLPIIGDGLFAGQGPLAGVLAGLDWAAGLGAKTLLTAPGDTPFIPSGLATALAPAPACAARDGRTHHLVALWPTTCRTALRRLLSTPGRRDVVHFTRAIGMRQVDFPSTKWDPFFNINTPEDLAVARARVEKAGE